MAAGALREGDAGIGGVEVEAEEDGAADPEASFAANTEDATGVRIVSDADAKEFIPHVAAGTAPPELAVWIEVAFNNKFELVGAENCVPAFDPNSGFSNVSIPFNTPTNDSVEPPDRDADPDDASRGVLARDGDDELIGDGLGDGVHRPSSSILSIDGRPDTSISTTSQSPPCRPLPLLLCPLIAASLCSSSSSISSSSIS